MSTSSAPIPEGAEYPAPQPSAAQPYYVRQTQDWAIAQERRRHEQALYTLGEAVLFVLMWHIEDFEAELVRRCPRCYSASSAIDRKISEAYNQPDQHRCPECFGTTFEGGFKAQIVRPAIFSDADEDERRVARGVVQPQDVSVESTPDFRVRSFDYVFRRNNERFQLRVPTRVTLRTGFETPTQSGSAIGYNHARANLEDGTSVAYDIPPSSGDLAALLGRDRYHPEDYAEFEIIRAPLIPAGND